MAPAFRDNPLMLPLRDYLSQRRTAVQAEIKALRAELAELDAAERALGGGNEQSIRRRGTAGSGKKTLKEMAMDVLRLHPEGLDASGIRNEIKRLFEVDIVRESLSPQLSRLGQAGDVSRDGLTWKLAQHHSSAAAYGADTNETPGASTPSVSDEEDPLKDLLG